MGRSVGLNNASYFRILSVLQHGNCFYSLCWKKAQFRTFSVIFINESWFLCDMNVLETLLSSENGEPLLVHSESSAAHAVMIFTLDGDDVYQRGAAGILDGESINGLVYTPNLHGCVPKGRKFVKGENTILTPVEGYHFVQKCEVAVGEESIAKYLAKTDFANIDLQQAYSTLNVSPKDQ